MITMQMIRSLATFLAIMTSNANPSLPLDQEHYQAWLQTRQMVVTSTIYLRKPTSQMRLEQLGIKNRINQEVDIAIRWRYPRDGITSQQASAVYDIVTTTYAVQQMNIYGPPSPSVPQNPPLIRP